MDQKLLSTRFEQNLASVKTFLEIMFNNVHKDIKEVRKENAELRRKNEEFRVSLEFSQSEIDILKCGSWEATVCFTY